MTGNGHTADASDDLHYELDRARIVPDGKLPEDTVRMGSTVTYRSDEGSIRTVTLVYPGQADISAGKVSILTPVGTALIGLKAGQAITWMSRDGHFRKLTALSVTGPAAAP